MSGANLKPLRDSLSAALSAGISEDAFAKLKKQVAGLLYDV